MSIHVTRAVDKSSWNTEHESCERRRSQATQNPSMIHDHFFPSLLPYWSRWNTNSVPSKDGTDIHHLLRTSTPASALLSFLTLGTFTGRTYLFSFSLYLYPYADCGRNSCDARTTRQTFGGRERGKTSNINGSGFAISPVPKTTCRPDWTESKGSSGSTRGRTDRWSPPPQPKRLGRVNGGDRRPERCRRTVLVWASIADGE